MALDDALRNRLVGILSEHDGSACPRLAADARRLWTRLTDFIAMRLLRDQSHSAALELACYALQLPLRQNRRLILRERCEQAAELMVGFLDKTADEELLDRAARLLHETPQKSPMFDEARLLADAVNLEDFGLTGLFNQAILHALAGEGVEKIVAAADRREQYGYWEARLRDGFHFEPIRQIAGKRLEQAREVCKMLKDEITEPVRSVRAE
jgi:hypothetical protein